MTTEVASPEVGRFNDWPQDAASAALLTCLGVPRWAREVVAGRPYADLPRLETAMRSVGLTLSDEELTTALARHPRIGERADAARHEADHSRREQSGIDDGNVELARQLREGNLAYEDRFGQVFIIRAAGRDGEEVLEQLRRRLQRTPEEERGETIEQLLQIAVLRLREALHGEALQAGQTTQEGVR